MVFFILFFFFVVVVFTVLALCIGITFIRVSAEQFTRFGLLVDLTDLVITNKRVHILITCRCHRNHFKQCRDA